MSTRINYRLPQTAVRLKATVTHTTDELGLTPAEPARAAVAEFVSIGDEWRLFETEVDDSILKDSKDGFELTEDGRLVSVDSELVGAGSRLVTGVVGVATTVAAVVGATRTPAARTMPRAVTGGPPETGDTEMSAARDAGKDEPKLSPEEAYARAHPDEAAIRVSLKARLVALLKELSEATEQAGSADADARWQAVRRLRAVTFAVAAVRGELERAEALFKTWRAAKLSTRTESIEHLIDIDSLLLAGARVSDGGTVLYTAPTDPTAEQAHANARRTVERILDDTGMIVTIEDPMGPQREDWNDDPVKRDEVDDEAIVTRLPRTVRVNAYSRRDGRLELVSSEERLILDRRSIHRGVRLSAGLFGEATHGLKFSANGVLIGYSTSAKSAAGAFADAVAGVPGTVASSLEQAGKIVDSVHALSDKSAELRLATLKRQIETRQKELELDGLAATEGSYVELERLKREADLLEQEKEIAGYRATPSAESRELAALQQEVAILRAKLEREITARALDAEAGLGQQPLTLDDLRQIAAGNGLGDAAAARQGA